MNNETGKLIQEITEEWFSDTKNILLKTKTEREKEKLVVIGMKMSSETLELLKKEWGTKTISDTPFWVGNSCLEIPIHIDETYKKLEIGLKRKKV